MASYASNASKAIGATMGSRKMERWLERAIGWADPLCQPHNTGERNRAGQLGRTDVHGKLVGPMRIDPGDPDVRWSVLRGAVPSVTAAHDPVLEFCRPYYRKSEELFDSDGMVPAWTYALAQGLWFDTATSQGLGAGSIRKALSWCNAQPDPVRACRALLVIHESSRGRTQVAGGSYDTVPAYIAALAGEPVAAFVEKKNRQHAQALAEPLPKFSTDDRDDEP